jgi:hypothetical protein
MLMHAIIIDLARILLIVLSEEIVDVLILCMLLEVSLHQFEGLRVYLHIIDIRADLIEKLIAALALKVSNHTLLRVMFVVFFIPSEKSFQSLQCIGK